MQLCNVNGFRWNCGRWADNVRVLCTWRFAGNCLAGSGHRVTGTGEWLCHTHHRVSLWCLSSCVNATCGIEKRPFAQKWIFTFVFINSTTTLVSKTKTKMWLIDCTAAETTTYFKHKNRLQQHHHCWLDVSSATFEQQRPPIWSPC